MSVTVREATIEDKRVIGETILSAGRSHLRYGCFDVAFSFALGDEETMVDLCSELCVRSEASCFHWRGFLIAEGLSPKFIPPTYRYPNN